MGIRVCRDCDKEEKEEKEEKKVDEREAEQADRELDEAETDENGKEAKDDESDEVHKSTKATKDRVVDAKVKEANAKGKKVEEKKIAFKNFLARPRAKEYEVLMNIFPGRLAEASLQMLRDIDTNVGMMYGKK